MDSPVRTSADTGPYDLIWSAASGVRRSPFGVSFMAIGVLLIVLGLMRISVPVTTHYDARTERLALRALVLGGSMVGGGGSLLIGGAVLIASARVGAAARSRAAE